MPARPAWPAAAPATPATPILGREAELDTLCSIIAPGRAGLVTLAGMGGVGKSRLAAEAAVRCLDSFGGRVAVVELDRIADPALLAVGIADALDLGGSASGRIVEQLCEAIGGEPALLVLENLEHLVAGAGLIRRLLDGAPSLTILVTSRREIGIDGERTIHLEPVAVPGPEENDPAAIASVPAVRILLADIRRDRPDFALTTHNAAAVAEICRRLEGLPLALELAAGALRVVPPHQLVDQLEERLQRMATVDRSVPRRQQTLEAAMAWSFDGLDPSGQVLYRRLGVFAGPFTPASAQAVLDGAVRRGAPALGATLASSCDALLEVNLLRRAADGPDGARYVMPAAVRLDARRRLDATRERAPVRWAHAYHLLEVAEAASAELSTDAAPGALDRLEAVHDDLRAALEWSAAEGRPAFTLRLAATLAEFWRARGHHTEGRVRLFAALQRAPEAPASDRCRAMIGEGSLASLQGDYARAAAILASALELAVAEGDESRAATALNWLGTNAFGEGRLETAAARCTEALDIRRRIGDDAGVASSLTALGGIAHFGGDFDRARALYEEARLIRERQGDRSALAITLAHIGLVERDRGEPSAAIARLEEAAAIWAPSGDRQRLAVVRHDRALVSLDLGDVETAKTMLRAVLVEARSLGDRALVANAHADLARAETLAGDSDAAMADAAEAVRLAVRGSVGPTIPLALEAAGMAAAGIDDRHAARTWGAAERIREETGFVLVPADAALLARAVAPVRERLGDASWEEARAEGRNAGLAAFGEATGPGVAGEAIGPAPEATSAVAS